jgi:hypothetical protein
MLSHPLPVFGLVSRYLTNYLIGRSPLPRRRSFSPRGHGVLPAFPDGYPPPRGTFDRVTRPFATKGFSFDLHVLAMPPAFNLSQDQTLQLNISDPTATEATADWSSKRVCLTRRPIAYARDAVYHAEPLQQAERVRRVSGRLVPEGALDEVFHELHQACRALCRSTEQECFSNSRPCWGLFRLVDPSHRLAFSRRFRNCSLVRERSPPRRRADSGSQLG